MYIKGEQWSKYRILGHTNRYFMHAGKFSFILLLLLLSFCQVTAEPLVYNSSYTISLEFMQYKIMTNNIKSFRQIKAYTYPVFLIVKRIQYFSYKFHCPCETILAFEKTNTLLFVNNLYTVKTLLWITFIVCLWKLVVEIWGESFWISDCYSSYTLALLLAIVK